MMTDEAIKLLKEKVLLREDLIRQIEVTKKERDRRVKAEKMLSDLLTQAQFITYLRMVNHANY